MTSHPNSRMGNLIRATFRKSGLSIKKLSEQAHVPYATVHGTITAVRDPSLSNAEKLCEVLALELRPVRRGKRKA